jgi:histone-lysine N-methyltransferase EZH2
VYEICTPAARNIKVGDDPDQMSFLPFADDPAFDWEPYNKEYGSFAWQHFQLNPACKSSLRPSQAGN